MPGKHVRFNEENIFYSLSVTPSPTYSQSSLPSSNGPYTPQYVVPFGPVTIHPFLAYHPSVPPINYDVSRTPYAYIRACSQAVRKHLAPDRTYNPYHFIDIKEPNRTEGTRALLDTMALLDIMHYIQRPLRGVCERLIAVAHPPDRISNPIPK